MNVSIDEDAEEEKVRHEEALKREKNISTAWGKKKGGFYGSETKEYDLDVRAEELEAAKEEEEEALKLQREGLAQHDEDDFGDIGTLQALAAAEEARTTAANEAAKKEASEAAANAPSTRNKGKKKKVDQHWDDEPNDDMPTSTSSSSINDTKSTSVPSAAATKKKVAAKAKETLDSDTLESMSSLGLSAGDLQVEKISKDLSNLSQDEKLAIVIHP
jgi:hypothetical protein